MSGSKINTYGSTNTSLTAIMNTLDSDRMSKIDAIGLTNMSTTSIPAIEAGSVIEIGGSIYRFSTTENISTTAIASTAALYWYVELVPSSSTVIARFSATIPVWRSDYQGFYTSTVSQNRNIARVYFSGITYDQKAILRWNDRIYVNSNQDNAIIACTAGNTAIVASVAGNIAIIACAAGNTAIYACTSSHYGIYACAVNYAGYFGASQGYAICAVASSNIGLSVSAQNCAGIFISSNNYGVVSCAGNYAGYFCVGGNTAICAVASSDYSIKVSAQNFSIYSYATGNRAIFAHAEGNSAIFACASSNTGIFSCAVGCYAVVGQSAGWAIFACATSTGLSGSTVYVGYPASGNGSYYNTYSDKNYKYLSDICIIKCLEDKPLKVYKYIWNDQNQSNFDQFVSPTAQDFADTFELTELRTGLFQMDGLALGLGIELLDRIKKLENALFNSTALGENYGN